MEIVSVIGLLLSVGALVGLMVSIVYYARQTRAAAQAQFQTSFITVSNAFMAYPQLRPLFYSGATPALDSGDQQRAETIAELLLDIFSLVLELEKHFRMTELAAGWRPYMTELLRSSAFLRTYLQAHLNWYPELTSYLPQPAQAEAAARP